MNYAINQLPWICFTACLLLLAEPVFAQVSTRAPKSDPDPITLKKTKLGSTKNVTQFGDIYLAGQFTEEDIELLKEKGIKRVITLRTDGEVKWDQAAALKAAGIEFVKIPFRQPETLTDDVIKQVRETLCKDADGKVMLHCGSANRVGAVWAAFRCCDQGINAEEAIAEGKKVGLRNEAYEKIVTDYMKRKSQEK